MPQAPLDRLKRLSRIMAGFTLALMVLLLVAGVFQTYIWLSDRAKISEQYPGVVADPALLSDATILAVIVIGWVTIGLMLYALTALRKMFKLFTRGQVLDPGAAAHLRRAGLTLLALAVYQAIAKAASILLLSLPNPEGQRQLAIGVDGGQLLSIFLAGVLLTIGHALLLGSDIAEENRSFV